VRLTVCTQVLAAFIAIFIIIYIFQARYLIMCAGRSKIFSLIRRFCQTFTQWKLYRLFYNQRPICHTQNAIAKTLQILLKKCIKMPCTTSN